MSSLHTNNKAKRQNNIVSQNKRTKFSKIRKSNNKKSYFWIADVADIVTFYNVKDFVWINPFGQSGH